ncbi:hypothetical protein [Pseudomonas sp. PNPG3]|uniref:hypothetical protein n=1 Tax=Pseudomonas sp. PNPG3 TaxID=2919497 RepID=UPI001FFCA70B|nr:hypothetical protein [Pseudomonas sp. PNPG3]MCK2122066.1 hypothetical protein [Pseudomonas sp. PNPG3]
MKPRAEKKLSKKLALLLAGTREYSDIWVDDEYYRHRKYGDLTPRQIRYNRESRVSVNHVPSIGGEPDYWGEGTDHYTVHEIYQRGLYDQLYYSPEFINDDRQWAEKGTPEREAWEVFKDAHVESVKRRYRHLSAGKNLLPHARREGEALRAKEARRAQELADFRAKRQQDAAARAA